MRRRRMLLVPALGSALGLALVVLPTVRTPSTAPPAVRMASETLTASGRTVTPGWSKVVTGAVDLVGVRWQGDRGATFAIEQQDARGHWSSAGSVGVPDGGPDPGTAEARRPPSGNVSEPVWLGHARAVRVRVASGSARAVDLEKVQVPNPPAASNVASAAAPQPAIIPRSQWGADESLRLANCPEGPSYDDNVELAIVHHTDGNNNYGPGDSPAIMRGLYAYATQTLKYCDMHYNFLVDKYGQVFEGRYGGIAAPVHGAHSVGFNTDTTGIAAMGNFQDNQAPPAMVAAIERLIAWKFDVHGVDPTRPVTYTTFGNDKFPAGTTLTLPTVIGHQDTWFTDCPGQYLEPLLPQIRSVAAAIMAGTRSWKPWEPMGDPLVSAPAVASWGGNRLDVFSVDAGGSLVQKWWNGQTWSGGWNNLSKPPGGAIVGGPTAVSWGPNRIDVFVMGGGGSLRHKWWDGSGWSTWENLGGRLTSAPTVTSWGPNRLDVFARAADGTLQHKFWNGQWSGWESLGGGLVGPPSAVAWGPGRIDVFVRGTDDQLYHQWYGGRWTGWEYLGGTLTAAPTVASWEPNRLDVFVRGSDRALWHRWWDGAHWLGYESQGGQLTGNPAAISKSWDRIDIFVGGTDQKLWHEVFG